MTLVEVLVVVLVFSMILGLAFVNLDAMYQKYRLDRGATDLKSFYEAVPSMARTQNRDIFVTWDAGTRTIRASTDQAGTQVLEQTRVAEYIVINPAPTAMRCDVVGRAYAGTSTNMLSAIATANVTHQKMVDGDLSPSIVYQVSLTPLWHVRMQKVVQ
jgi:type II secretory pathway pseudopilin PulG